jgi:small-conductance mechanosensitive channel
MENNMRNTEEIIDVESTIEVKKKDIVDKALDFVIGIGEEIKEHPIHTAVTAAIGIFCYRKGKKKGYKKGNVNGQKYAVNKIRSFTNYINNDTGEEWNLLDLIAKREAEYIITFTPNEADEYNACSAYCDEYRKSKSST